MEKVALAKTSISAAILSLAALLLLHFVSPEFDPSWRMASEYANGKHPWLIACFFIFWGLSSCSLAILLRKQVSGKAGKTGVVLLFISGIGETLAALFDVNHSGHGFAGLLGIPTLPIAALLIAYSLRKDPNWQNSKKTLVYLSHAPWLSLVLMIITMVVMMSGFQQAGFEMGPGAPVPEYVPEGVVALAGYANRLLILAYEFWLLFVARASLKQGQTIRFASVA